VVDATASRVGAAFEAMLVEPMLAPLVAECAFGQYGAGLIADEIARHDSCGFGALVARWLEFGRERS
jgi:predicted phosphoribosyltransferase